jgi:hypothetical protein
MEVEMTEPRDRVTGSKMTERLHVDLVPDGAGGNRRLPLVSP